MGTKRIFRGAADGSQVSQRRLLFDISRYVWPSDPRTVLQAVSGDSIDPNALTIIHALRPNGYFLQEKAVLGGPLAGLYYSHDLVEERAVRGDGVAAVNRPLAAPVRESPARLLDYGQKRRAVPDVHQGVEHNVRAARGYEHVAVAVAPRSTHRRATLKLFGRRAEALARARAEVGR